MFRRSGKSIDSRQSRAISPLTAAGLLLMLVSATALLTYGILTVPGVLAAKGGPPEVFLEAATQQAAQATPSPGADQDTAAGQDGTPAADGLPTEAVDATPTADPNTAANASTSGRLPEFRPTVNPYGDWPLPDWVDERYWLSIPQIALEAPVIGLSPTARNVEGADVLRLPVPNSFSVAWDQTSAQPGFAGNTVLTGHSNFYGGVFGNLDQLVYGSEIAIWSEYGVFSYYVSSIEYIEENGQSLDVRLQNAQWLNDTLDDRVTLITCWPTSDSSHRLVIVGTR